MEKREREDVAWYWAVLFGAYLGVLFYLLFFSEEYGRTMGERGYRYNLELFKEIKRFWGNWETIGIKNVMINLAGNVAAFAPFGFFAPMYFRWAKNIFGCTFVTALFSLLVEAIQLVSKVGAFDVDDIVLNAAGGFVGFLCYFILLGRRNKEKKK